MKIKLSYHLFVALVAGLLCIAETNAQDTAPVTDTAAAIETSPAEEYDSSQDVQTYYPDTLKSEFRKVVYDSVRAINNDKGFYYKRYMDSLLRATAKKVNNTPKRRAVINDGFFSSLFTLMLWVAAVALFAFLIFRLFLINSSIFSRNRKNVSVDIDTTTETETTDPDAKLRNAIKNGHYRMAVRYLYLQTLIKLYENKFIDMGSNKTNYEYVKEVRNQKFANEFASLTLQYEYVWYGEYPLDEGLFSQIQGGFELFHKNISR